MDVRESGAELREEVEESRLGGRVRGNGGGGGEDGLRQVRTEMRQRNRQRDLRWRRLFSRPLSSGSKFAIRFAPVIDS